MKNKLKLLLIIPLLFVTGCSINYNLRVDSNLNFKENATISEKNDVLNIYNKNLKLVPDQKFSQYESFDGFESYDLKKKLFEKDSTGGIVEAWFNGIDKYKKSLLLTSVFSDINVTNYGNISSIQFIGYNPSVFVSEEDEEFQMDDITVNIRFHNEVVENNAQSYDEKTNTYTWVLNENKESGNIMFSIDQSKKRYDIIIKDFFSDHLATIITLSVLAFAVIVAACVLYSKNQKSNKI